MQLHASVRAAAGEEPRGDAGEGGAETKGTQDGSGPCERLCGERRGKEGNRPSQRSGKHVEEKIWGQPQFMRTIRRQPQFFGQNGDLQSRLDSVCERVRARPSCASPPTHTHSHAASCVFAAQKPRFAPPVDALWLRSRPCCYKHTARSSGRLSDFLSDRAVVLSAPPAPCRRRPRLR